VRIGVILPIGHQESLDRPFSYGEIRAFAQRAEEAGFDSVWLYDHLLYRRPGKPTTGVWEATIIWAALAEATSRVELGALVLCTAFRNPSVTAKLAATLDEVSGGRITLGLGAGWHEPEFAAFGIPFDHRVSRFEEACKIIVPLVREGKVDFQGQYYSAPDCEILPRPSRRIPVLIAGNGPRMLQITARYADQWNTAWLGSVEALAPYRDALHAACAEVGRDPGTLEITVGVNVAFPSVAEPPERASDPLRFLTGSVSEVAAGLRGYRDAGVSHVICWLYPVNEASIDLLAEAVQQVRAG